MSICYAVFESAKDVAKFIDVNYQKSGFELLGITENTTNEGIRFTVFMKAYSRDLWVSDAIDFYVAFWERIIYEQHRKN